MGTRIGLPHEFVAITQALRRLSANMFLSFQSLTELLGRLRLRMGRSPDDAVAGTRPSGNSRRRSARRTAQRVNWNGYLRLHQKRWR